MCKLNWYKNAKSQLTNKLQLFCGTKSEKEVAFKKCLKIPQGYSEAINKKNKTMQKEKRINNEI
jgi:hypothetical protein